MGRGDHHLTATTVAAVLALATGGCGFVTTVTSGADGRPEPVGPAVAAGPVPGTHGQMATAWEAAGGGYCVEHPRMGGCGSSPGSAGWGGTDGDWCMDAVFDADVRQVDWAAADGQTGTLRPLGGTEDLPFSVFGACFDTPMPDDVEHTPVE